MHRRLPCRIHHLHITSQEQRHTHMCCQSRITQRERTSLGSSLSLSPAITLEPREMDDTAREVLLLRFVPLAAEPFTASPLLSAIPILLFRLLRQPGYTPLPNNIYIPKK